jgi:hypothetical protein
MEQQTKIGIGAAAGITLMAILEPHFFESSRILTILIYVVLIAVMIWGFARVAVGITSRLRGGIYRVWPQYLMTLAAVLFFVGLLAFLRLNVVPPSNELTADKNDSKPAPKNPEPTIADSTPTPKPSGIRKYIFDGLTNARDDLLSIKKDNLSCDALNAWQTRADAATRLAHANGIGIHNPISQYLGACQKSTDIELLEAIRMSIVQLLNQGIQAAGS